MIYPSIYHMIYLQKTTVQPVLYPCFQAIGQSFQRETSHYCSYSPWNQHGAFSNEEMLLSCSINHGCQICQIQPDGGASLEHYFEKDSETIVSLGRKECWTQEKRAYQHKYFLFAALEEHSLPFPLERTSHFPKEKGGYFSAFCGL